MLFLTCSCLWLNTPAPGALYSEFQRAEGQAARLYEGQCALALGDAARAETIFVL